MEKEPIPATALYLGYFATACFTLQYAPQAYLNYKRKSVKGFSSTGILIKLVGASFLAVNAYLMGEATPVVIYGIFNVCQHLIFMFQFMYFTGEMKFLWYCLIPVVPYVMGTFMPETIPLTAMLKPLSQVLSHFPQLFVTWQKKSSEGVALTTQHLNILGGCAGLMMYQIIEAKSVGTIFVYINSIFQAVSMYALAVYFDGMDRIIQSIPIIGEGELSNNNKKATTLPK